MKYFSLTARWRNKVTACSRTKPRPNELTMKRSRGILARDMTGVRVSRHTNTAISHSSLTKIWTLETVPSLTRKKELNKKNVEIELSRFNAMVFQIKSFSLFLTMAIQTSSFLDNVLWCT